MLNIFLATLRRPLHFGKYVPGSLLSNLCLCRWLEYLLVDNTYSSCHHCCSKCAYKVLATRKQFLLRHMSILCLFLHIQNLFGYMVLVEAGSKYKDRLDPLKHKGQVLSHILDFLPPFCRSHQSAHILCPYMAQVVGNIDNLDLQETCSILLLQCRSC